MIVEMRDVSVIRNHQYILRDINWSINENEHWIILGLNGSGKTTLLNMLNGYIFPSVGDVTVLNRVLGKYDMRQLRKSIGWVSSSIQERFHGHETTINTVLSGKFASIGLYDDVHREDLRFAKSLLEKLQILHLENRSYNSLSQGEKQRVLIARGLMSKPSLLILDEPCNGLDVFAKELLLQMIEDLAKDRNSPTLIYVTHQIEEILPSFSQLLLLKDGQVYASGPIDKLLTKEKLENFFSIPLTLEKSDERYSLKINLEDIKGILP